MAKRENRKSIIDQNKGQLLPAEILMLYPTIPVAIENKNQMT